MKYIQAVILAAVAVSSAANKGSEPVASPTAAEFDELYHRQLQKKTKAPTVPKTKAPVMTKAPVGDGTPVPTDDDSFGNSMSYSSFSISAKTSKVVEAKAAKSDASVSMSVEAKVAKGRRNLRVSDSAVHVPVAAPSVARELEAYERQLGTAVTGTPTEFPPRPTGSASLSFSTKAKATKVFKTKDESSISMSVEAKTVKEAKAGKEDASMSSSMSVSTAKVMKEAKAEKVSKAGKEDASMSMSASYSYVRQ